MGPSHRRLYARSYGIWVAGIGSCQTQHASGLAGAGHRIEPGCIIAFMVVGKINVEDVRTVFRMLAQRGAYRRAVMATGDLDIEQRLVQAERDTFAVQPVLNVKKRADKRYLCRTENGAKMPRAVNGLRIGPNGSETTIVLSLADRCNNQIRAAIDEPDWRFDDVAIEVDRIAVLENDLTGRDAGCEHDEKTLRRMACWPVLGCIAHTRKDKPAVVIVGVSVEVAFEQLAGRNLDGTASGFEAAVFETDTGLVVGADLVDDVVAGFVD